MADKLIKNVNGEMVSEESITVSTGASSAGKIPALDSNGKWDNSFMPSGIGADTVTLPAIESLSAGAFVNIYDNAGTISVRNADNTDNTKPASGFVKSEYASAASAVVYLEGDNDALTGLAVGTKYFLDTAGGYTATVPTAKNSIIQPLGLTKATTTIRFEQNDYIKNA